MFVEKEALEAAQAEFWHRGYEGVGITRLCTAMGISSQSLYGAFGSKHKLFMRTLEDYCTNQLDGLRVGLDRATSAWQWALDVATFQDEHRVAITRDGCFLAGSAATHSRLDSEVAAVARRTYTLMAEYFAEAVEAAQHSGDVRHDTTPRRVADAVLITMQGLEFVRRAGYSDVAFDAARDTSREALHLAYGARPNAPAPAIFTD